MEGEGPAWDWEDAGFWARAQVFFEMAEEEATLDIVVLVTSSSERVVMLRNRAGKTLLFEIGPSKSEGLFFESKRSLQ